MSWDGQRRLEYLASVGLTIEQLQAYNPRNVDYVILWLHQQVEGADLITLYGGQWRDHLDSPTGYKPGPSECLNAGVCQRYGYYWNPRRNACFLTAPQEPETPTTPEVVGQPAIPQLNRYIMEVELEQPATKEVIAAITANWTMKFKKTEGYALNSVTAEGNIVKIDFFKFGSIGLGVIAMIIILIIVAIVGVIAWRIIDVETQRVAIAKQSQDTASWMLQNEGELIDSGWSHEEVVSTIQSLNNTAGKGLESTLPDWSQALSGISTGIGAAIPLLLFVMLYQGMRK